MLDAKQYLKIEKRLHLLYKRSMSVSKSSNEYKILKKTSEFLLLFLENTLKEIQKKENTNVHKLIQQSNTEILSILLDKIHRYRIKN